MRNFFQKLGPLLRFRRQQPVKEATIDEILRRSSLRLHNVDPGTRQQWLRLQRAIAQADTKAAPAKSRLIPRLALGVAVAAVAMVGIYVYYSFTQRPPDIFATAKGEQKEVVLGDGSQITLNYATELVVPKLQPGKPRRISLSGEAYFRVRPSGTPFIVSTQYAEVEVAGTEFNLRAREGALEVSVIDGLVNVSVVNDGKDSTLLLTQHQMAVCPQNDFPRRIEDIPSPDYPGWKHGKLFLNRMPLLAACREIEMRFDVTIRIDDQRVGSDIIAGILDAKTAESVVAALCELTGKRFTRDGQTYTIY